MGQEIGQFYAKDVPLDRGNMWFPRGLQYGRSVVS